MSVKTDYEKVCEFNKAFDFPQYNDFVNEKTLKLRLDLIKEELDELKEAYSNTDFIEILDACADILYVAYGMAYTYKINSDEFLNYLVLNNNISLFKNIVSNNTKIIEIEKIINMIYEEYNKLETYCKENNKDWVNVLHNIILYVYDLQKQMKYDSDKIFTIVHDSNMSKLCKSEIEAQQTVEKYQQEYNAGKSPYDSVFYYKLKDSDLYVIKNKSTGKALKSINYTKVKLNVFDLLL
jgi:predicted HAD superfamily Cof-like phosphohydrolase